MLESLFNDVADTPTQVFSCEYCEIFKNSFFYRTPPVVDFDFNFHTTFKGKPFIRGKIPKAKH